MSPGKFKGNTTYGPAAAPQPAPERRGDFTVRQAIHAAIEDSAEGSLTTKQIVNFIRLNFGHWKLSTVSHCLSYYGDFQKIKTRGGGDCRWALAGTFNGIETLPTPTQFNRISTPITHAYLKSGAGKFTVWAACHAVLNASSEESLPTDEIENRIRRSYPHQDFARSTLASTLSREDDFRRWSPPGKGPGRWFLTGIIGGIKTTESCGTTDTALPSGDASVTIDDDITPPTAEFPYNRKTEEIEAQYSPEPTHPSPPFSSSLLPELYLGSDHPPRTGGAVRPCRGTGRLNSRYQPYSATKTPKEHKYTDLANQLGTTVPPPNTTDSFDLNNCNSQELAVQFDLLQLLPLPAPAPSQPEPDSPLASFSSWSPNGAEAHGSDALYTSYFENSLHGLPFGAMNPFVHTLASPDVDGTGFLSDITFG